MRRLLIARSLALTLVMVDVAGIVAIARYVFWR
jgi:hypothetical protein